MKKFFKFIALVCIVAIVQNSFAQNVLSEIIKIRPWDGGDTICLQLDLVCVEMDEKCIIDGNIYILDCQTEKTMQTGTYHIENKNDDNGWQWSTSAFPHHLGIDLELMLMLVKLSQFPVSCCGAGGVLPCVSPTHLETEAEYNIILCTQTNIECCDGVFSITYNIIDCNTKEILLSNNFTAIYDGRANPEKPSDTSNWVLFGNNSTENQILQSILPTIDFNACLPTTPQEPPTDF